jgi:hypothetical protein
MTNIHRVHKTRLKLVINPVLRKIQYWTDKPYVIASCFEKKEFITYKIQRVQYYKYEEPPADIEIVEIKVNNPLLKTIKHFWRKLNG